VATLFRHWECGLQPDACCNQPTTGPAAALMAGPRSSAIGNGCSTTTPTPTVVGRHLSISDQRVTIVGVAPEGFEGILVAEHPGIYLPLECDAALYGETGLHSGTRLWLITFARVRSGVSRSQAEAEMATVFPAVRDEVLPPAFQHVPVERETAPKDLRSR
jgi:hypothetical protein